MGSRKRWAGAGAPPSQRKSETGTACKRMFTGELKGER